MSKHSDSRRHGDDATPPPYTTHKRTSRSKQIKDLSAVSDGIKSTMPYQDAQCQLIPVEIEKEAELGLVLGLIEGEHWLFIDEILPNGMIEMHGILKEGDYLIQAGMYSLEYVNMATALVLIERAYDEGKKSVSFVGARRDPAAAPVRASDPVPQRSTSPRQHVSTREPSRAQSSC